MGPVLKVVPKELIEIETGARLATSLVKVAQPGIVTGAVLPNFF
jgi:hypothetical protein